MSCKSCDGAPKIIINRTTRSTPSPKPLRAQAVSIKPNRKLVSNNQIKVRVSTDLDKHRK